MQFKIVGANAESGDDIDVMLEAPSQPDVEKLAHEKGILVSSITPLSASANGQANSASHAPAHSAKDDPGAIALVDDDPPTNGSPGEHHERAAGIITVSANAPSDTSHSAEGHIAEVKRAEAHAEYHIIMNQSLYLLETAVNKHLRDGWDVAGGMSVATNNNALQYFQSMIRRKKT